MNILVIDAWLPTPNKDGGSLRMFNLLKVLQSLESQITFAADDFASRASGYPALHTMGINVLIPPQVDSIPQYLAAHGAGFDVVIVSRAPQAAKYLSLVREHAPAVRIVFDTTDLHFLRAYRSAKVSGNLGLLQQALKLKQQELAAVRSADMTLVVSPVEQEILARECPGAPVRVVSNIHPLHGCARPFQERTGILFVGSFPHHPNTDAMYYFFNEVYPQLETREKGLPITIIGSQPPDWLRERASDTVKIMGHVPDIAPYLERSRVSIAPLRIGAGVKGKVLESMSYGVPCVISSVAAEGIPCWNGRDALVADEPDSFAEAVCEVYRNPQLWNRVSEGGIELVRANFSAEVARIQLTKIFHEFGLAVNL